MLPKTGLHDCKYDDHTPDELFTREHCGGCEVSHCHYCGKEITRFQRFYTESWGPWRSIKETIYIDVPDLEEHVTDYVSRTHERT